MISRHFTVRYANWAPAKVIVPGNKIKSTEGIEVVRAAVGHAFNDKLGGYWQDGPDIQVVLSKDNPGVWIGERRHPQTGKKADPFYVLET